MSHKEEDLGAVTEPEYHLGLRGAILFIYFGGLGMIHMASKRCYFKTRPWSWKDSQVVMCSILSGLRQPWPVLTELQRQVSGRLVESELPLFPCSSFSQSHSQDRPGFQQERTLFSHRLKRSQGFSAWDREEGTGAGVN